VSRSKSVAANVRSVVADSLRAGHAKAKAVLSPAQSWLAGIAKKAGIDVAGFRHVLDADAVRHIRRKHGSQAERARGQVPVSDADFEALPQVVESPEKVIFGAKNKRGHDLIGYLKKMPDGHWLYFEEARTGRHELAATSLRKYPATMDAQNVIKTISADHLNVQNDGGNGLIVRDGPGADQSGIETHEVAPDDAPPETRDLLERQQSQRDRETGDAWIADHLREDAKAQGERDADSLGLREAVTAVLGDDHHVTFLANEDGLP
jgi:hypothetical protein